MNKLTWLFKKKSKTTNDNVNMAMKFTSTKRQSYTVSDKLRIIHFAEENGNRAAEREFGVSESNVRLWRKSKQKPGKDASVEMSKPRKEIYLAGIGSRSAGVDY